MQLCKSSFPGCLRAPKESSTLKLGSLGVGQTEEAHVAVRDDLAVPAKSGMRQHISLYQRLSSCRCIQDFLHVAIFNAGPATFCQLDIRHT